MNIKKLNKLATIPQYATDGSAAVDLHACFEYKEVVKTIYPGQTLKIGTGFAIENPIQQDIAALIIPRSGLGTNSGIVLGNLTGLIDQDYRGEIIVALWNRSNDEYDIRHGDRIAQMMFVPIARVEFNLVDEFAGTTSRGENGFGSTGK